jgi:amino acid permease
VEPWEPAPEPSITDHPRRVRRAGAWLASGIVRNAEGALYGVMLVGVLLAAEDAHHETYAETIAVAAIVIGIYWWARIYTHVLGVRLDTREPLGRELIWRSAVHELPVVEGASVQVLVLLVAWITGVSLATGVKATVAATVVSVVALEIAAGWRTGSRGRSVWFSGVAGAVIGLGVVGVKVVLQLH